MTRINLLPWREMRRKEEDRQLMTIGMGAAMVMGLIVLFAYLQISTMIEAQTGRNQFLEGEIAKVETEIKEIREIKKQRDALVARMKVIQALQGTRTQIVHAFDDLVRHLPEGVYLTSLKQTGKAIALNGVAQSNARVSAFMRNLDSSNWFENPDLDVVNVVAEGNDRVSKFILRVNQADKEAAAKETAKTSGTRQSAGDQQ